MHPADRAWITLAAGVAVWDALSPADEMLSDGSRRHMEVHPWLTGAIICYTAGHLMHVIPVRADLFTRVSKALGR